MKKRKHYTDEFVPYTGFHFECSNNYIEVGRACYQHPELKKSKNDILVYSAILATMNNYHTSTCSYTNVDIGRRIAMDESAVRRSIRKLKELGLITTTVKGNKRSIKILQDLRYQDTTGNKKSKKSVYKFYDRMFCYPLIDKTMVHIYSYYLSLRGLSKYQEWCNVSTQTVANSLGCSRSVIQKSLEKMEELGVIQMSKGINSKSIKLLVDFSKKQPEEIAYEQEREKRLKDIREAEETGVKNEHTPAQTGTGWGIQRNVVILGEEEYFPCKCVCNPRT